MTSTSPLTQKLPPALQIDQDTDFTPDVWARAMLYLISRIAALESFEPAYSAAIDELNRVALGRINDVLLPLVANFNYAADLGAIFQGLSTPTKAVSPASAGTTVIFQLDTGTQLATFCPSQYMCALSSNGQFALSGLVTSFSRLTGLLVMEVFEAVGNGTGGPWIITPTCPPFLASPAVDAGNIDAPVASISIPYIYAGPVAVQTS